jgi:phage shock protein A
MVVEVFMTGFLQKLRAFSLGAAHDVLDKAVDMNSPSMLRQYVRDLEDATGKMNSEAAIQLGQVMTLTRERDNLKAKIDADTEAVKKILDSSPDLARSKGALILQNKSHLAQTESDIVAQRKVSDELALAVSKLQAKHDLMVSRVRELERIDRDSKTKESAAAALNQAGSLIGSVGSESVDDLEDRMRRRNDVASAKFDQSMAAVPEEQDSADVDDFLASLKPEAVAK